MSKITIKGRIGKIQHIETGSSPRVKFSVAEGVPPENGSSDWGTNWFECVAWKNAKKKLEGIEKGQMVLVEGNFSPKEYGGKIFLNVLAFNVELLAAPKKSTGNDLDTEICTDDIPF